jgi:hypothetical protein
MLLKVDDIVMEPNETAAALVQECIVLPNPTSADDGIDTLINLINIDVIMVESSMEKQVAVTHGNLNSLLLISFTDFNLPCSSRNPIQPLNTYNFSKMADPQPPNPIFISKMINSPAVSTSIKGKEMPVENGIILRLLIIYNFSCCECSKQ